MELERIIEIIADQMSVSKDKITMDSSFADDLGADSLDIFQIISELEEEYNMEFSNEDAESIKTVGDAVNYIKARIDE